MKTQGRITLSLWSWRESNPRPNREPEGFLHAYPSFHPSLRTRHTAAQYEAQSVKSRRERPNMRRSQLLIVDTPMPAEQEAGPAGGVLVPAPPWAQGLR